MKEYAILIKARNALFKVKAAQFHCDKEEKLHILKDDKGTVVALVPFDQMEIIFETRDDLENKIPTNVEVSKALNES